MLAAQAAQQYAPKDRERFMEYVMGDAVAAAQLRAPLYEDKVVDFLFDKAEITDRAATREELEAAIESEDDAIGHVHGPGCGHDHHDHDHDHGAAKPKKAAAKKAAPAEAKDEAAPAKKPAAKKAAVAEEAPAKPAAKAKKADAEVTADEKPAKAPAKKAAPKKAKAD